jgi:soluble epoxide hydrolase / lipid-phosphate phosphatase
MAFQSNVSKKTLQTRYEYTYYVAAPQPGKPTILLLHGWPDSAREWVDVVNDYLLPAGYGIICPDILGFGESSQPRDHDQYAFHLIAADLVAIMDAEGVSEAVAMGHDVGSSLVSRLYHHHPTRVIGLVTVSLGYFPPATEPFSVDKVNEATTKAFGYGTFHYWNFFTAPDASDILNKHLDSLYDALHDAPKTWLQTMCAPSGMRDFIVNDRAATKLEKYATSAHRDEFIARMTRDGFAGPQCYYTALTSNTQYESDKQIPPENARVDKPVLFWGGNQDLVCRPELIQGPRDAGLLPNLTVKSVDGGHWALLAQPERFGEDVLNWLKENIRA